MNYFKSFNDWLNESFNVETEHWYKILADSHEKYVNDEEDYNNPDNDWDEEEFGPKHWIFETPVHEYLKKKDMLSVVPAIIKFGESLGMSSDTVEIEHYMMNDFSIQWKGFEYPEFSISLEGDEHETQARILRKEEDRTLHNTIGAHLIIKLFTKDKPTEIEWSLTSKDDIGDAMMDIYSLKIKKWK